MIPAPIKMTAIDAATMIRAIYAVSLVKLIWLLEQMEFMIRLGMDKDYNFLNSAVKQFFEQVFKNISLLRAIFYVI